MNLVQQLHKRLDSFFVPRCYDGEIYVRNSLLISHSIHTSRYNTTHDILTLIGLHQVPMHTSVHAIDALMPDKYLLRSKCCMLLFVSRYMYCTRNKQKKVLYMYIVPVIFCFYRKQTELTES